MRFGHWFGNYLVIGIWSLVVLVSGCARTVTQHVTYGKEMVVEVTLRASMEIEVDRYFLVLASRESYRVPLPPSNQIDSCPEFIEPDMIPKLGSLEAYFANFFSTWSGYVAVDPGGYFSAAGPFVQGQAVSRESFASLGEESTKIKFNFRLDRIFGSNIPNTIYFDFVTVEWPVDNPKIPRDHLTSTNAYISKVVGSTITIDDEEDNAIDASLDILRCTVTIQ